ncbi:MAG: hypothetical protein LBT80_07250 [Lactobacillaceae bacterium]|jgi:hypothetical protein|nr:hypothetical protein [Lactobacillaceae bacterium]
MFEKTKKRVITDELATILPNEAATLIWEKFDTMLTYQAIKQPLVEIQIADAVEDGQLGFLFVQDGEESQELEGAYAGPTEFLGKALIVDIHDRVDGIYLDFADRLKAYLMTMPAPVGYPDAEWRRLTILGKYQAFVKANF